MSTNIEEYQKIYNHHSRNINQEYRLKNIDERKNYFIKEINQNELMSKKHKKVFRVLNYIENLLLLVSTVTGYISIFFTS